MNSFNPNATTFEEGIEYLKTVSEESGFAVNGIVTSRDEGVMRLADKLAIDNIPSGFQKTQLPVFFDGPSQFYLSRGAPNSKVPSHSHDEGDGLRVILDGSIHYKDRQLGAGDWMFIPKGQKYEFEVGADGVSMFYCYQCSCR